MFKSYILVLATLLAAMIMAAPVADRSTTAAALNKRATSGTFSGRGTWFSDTTGSCDISFDQSDMIVAMNQAQMGALQGSNSKCGQMIRVSYGGKSVDLKIVDTCPSQYCSRGQIDLSQAAFKELAGGLSKGVLALNWKFI
ncbi:hypothetical protein BGX28_006619 [Mortierella sp. GBA30]|nr:hypothetical protein BGX28_006619 [Mortierella sp. GBA30]